MCFLELTTTFAKNGDVVSDNPTSNDNLNVPKNFITNIIDEDLQSGKHSQVVTRFPPEPNGYLHIGHAKSICLNFGLALDYDGKCHLRFDDTNPLKESDEYVESIKRDVAWLGFDWGENLFFASDYFEDMFNYAVSLIKQGKAYVDSQTLEEIREQRGTLSEPGTNSPHRERSVEENLDLFNRMRAGEFEDGAHVLRAKIDMAASNMIMRDPVIYRIRHAHHHRTGDAWCIYPMYDFAHCLEDATEHITHSLCTLEFENNREVYEWLINNLDVPAKPRQIEFARLGLEYTVMSKRKFLVLVDEGIVNGWDDPRMPTIAGLRRRGVTPASIRQFAAMVGVAKANSMVDLAKLDYCVRDDLNHKAPRVMGVLEPLKVTITNFPEDKVDLVEGSYWPHDVPKEGSRELPFTRELYIERSDFQAEPEKGFFRLAPGREVRLRYAYYITCQEVVRNDEGEIVELLCTYDPESRGGSTPDGRKVKGTIHWVSATEGVKAEVRLYEPLMIVPRPDQDERPFEELINPTSLVTVEAVVEPSLKDLAAGEHVQFERQGYFFSEPEDHEAGERLVFNRVVALKDSWGKQHLVEAKDEQVVTEDDSEGDDSSPTRVRPPKRTRAEEREIARERNPELVERYTHYLETVGLEQEDADVLSGDLDLSNFYNEALATGIDQVALTNWVINELLRELKDTPVSDLKFSAAEFAALVKLHASDTISSKAAKDVFAILMEEGGDPVAIVEEKGLTQISDEGAIQKIIDKVIAENPVQLQQYKDGKTKLVGFFIGKVLAASKGKADPTVTRELIGPALDNA